MSREPVEILTAHLKRHETDRPRSGGRVTGPVELPVTTPSGRRTCIASVFSPGERSSRTVAIPGPLPSPGHAAAAAMLSPFAAPTCYRTPHLFQAADRSALVESAKEFARLAARGPPVGEGSERVAAFAMLGV
jgi:hypothetical protein